MSKKYIGNLVQSLSGGSGGGGGGDTGVGKPYPGSTGGEYFNYYGDDSNKNEAPGDYSTTIGYNNKNKGKYSFIAGANNKATVNISSGNYIIGYNNEQYSHGPSYIFGSNNKNIQSAIVIGYDNGTNAYSGIGSSYNNMVIGYNARSACREGIVLGNNLAGNGYEIGTTILGTCNKKDNQDYGLTERITRNSSTVIVGAGTSNNRLNAIEIDNTGLVAFPHSICLDSTTTSVNAITAPQDPNNITTDDQTLATKSYVDANSGSGGVGQAYSGSTGGEIFNYYGIDSDANVASGNYSTAIGFRNSSSGRYCFTGGIGNTNKGQSSIVFGANNETTTASVHDVVLGSGNKDKGTNSQGDNVIIGLSNTLGANSRYGVCIGSANTGTCNYGIMLGSSNNSVNYSGARLIGDNLTCSIGNQFVIGRYNAVPSLSDARFIIGVGTGSDSKKNAVEIGNSNNTFKIRCNLALETDATEVNAITPPQDPQNVTADDQTLVTKSYVSGVLPPTAVQSTVGYFETSLSNSVYPNTDGTPLTLASFTTIPSWANHALVYFHWEGETHFKDIILDRDSGLHLDIWQTSTSGTPLQIRHAHYRIEYTSLDKAITATDYWEYTQDATNNTISGTITGLSNITYNARILSVVYTA